MTLWRGKSYKPQGPIGSTTVCKRSDKKKKEKKLQVKMNGPTI